MVDTTTDSLIGYARVNVGYEAGDILRHSRLSKTTFYSRLKRPEDLRLGELRHLIKLCRYTDEQILEIVKGAQR